MNTVASPSLPEGRLSCLPEARGTLESVRRALGGWPAVIAVCASLWLAARLAFFIGFEGSDDLFHVRFAAAWDRPPIDQWESRLAVNALLRLSMALLGPTETAAVLPSMLSSAALTGVVLWWCRRHAMLWQAWWAGLLAALLPVEILVATTITASPLTDALLACGTAALLAASGSRTGRITAACCLGLAPVVHPMAMFYLAALGTAVLVVAPRRYGRTLALVAAAAVLCMAVELGVWAFLYGDASLKARIVARIINSSSVIPERTLTPEKAAWALQHLLVSKGFGLAAAAALAGGLLCWRRLGPPLRVLAVTALLYWCWVGFGSYLPWSYRPITPTVRYLHPLVFPVCLLFAATVTDLIRRPAAARAAGVAVLVSCLAASLASGSWGQNVEISRELLACAQRHPELRFVTDLYTINEMYVLNGLRTPANMQVTRHALRRRRMDSGVACVPAQGPWPADAILVNPLNLARSPAEEQEFRARAGAVLYRGREARRPICSWMPLFRDADWSVRRPPAEVLAIRADQASPSVPASSTSPESMSH